MEQRPVKDFFALRAEWLRLRSRLYDKATGLPTLPAVLEEVRRLSENGQDVGVVYLGIDQSAHLEEIYGWQQYDRLLAATAASLEQARGQELAESDLLALRGIRGDELLVFTKCLGDPGRHLQQVRTALLSRLRGSQLPFLPADNNQTQIFLTGQSLISRDARIRFERLVYQAVEQASRAAVEAQESHRQRQHRTLQALLETDGLVTLFQPIYHLETGIVYGYEALTRGPENTEFESAEALFSFAEQTDLIMELERRCRIRAFSLGRSEREPGRLFINCSVQCLYDREFDPEALSAEAARAGLENHQVVFEITERVAVHDWDRFRTMLRSLKQRGFAVAIDDMGAGYSNLKLLAEIEPDFLKLDISLVRGADSNLVKLELLRTLQGLAQKIGAQVIAEGLESEAEHRVVKELGIPYGQGFFLARPAACKT
jgi:EAL domain-containing protein (putative c-di-GMP-specific phosphodiesterase class I)